MYLYLKQKVFSITEKFTFFDETGQPVYTARGSFFALPKRYNVIDTSGQEVLSIERAFFTFLPRFALFGSPKAEPLCTIKRKFSFRPNFTISAPHGEYTIQGSLFGYNFQILDSDGVSVITVSKQIIAWGDTYQIHFDEQKIPPHIAAGIIIAIDCAVHSDKN